MSLSLCTNWAIDPLNCPGSGNVTVCQVRGITIDKGSGDFGFWHKADFTTFGINVRCWQQRGNRNSITTDLRIIVRLKSSDQHVFS
jgi:hypothetical protein